MDLNASSQWYVSANGYELKLYARGCKIRAHHSILRKLIQCLRLYLVKAVRISISNNNMKSSFQFDYYHIKKINITMQFRTLI